ncbi:MAG: DUF86 domain-containing protein [Candidatus Dadabacteria bacterium]|nr:DUF86 domain-containing protein [Candidatus Dadabacteria bacterium]
MQRNESAYLLDMLLAAQDVEEFTSDLTFQQFLHSRLHQHAILKIIEIIGEAATHVGKETRKANSQIPWQSITSMRNRLVHGYFDVDLDRVWETAQRDISQLIELVKPLVPPDEN